MYDEDENMTYAYDNNLELLDTTKGNISDAPINEIFPKEEAKVKEKTINNN